MFYSCSPGARSSGGKTARRPVRKSRSFTVDIHCHFTSQRADDLAHPLRKAADEPTLAVISEEERARHRAYIASLDARIRGADKRLKEMDAMGIDVQVVSPGPMQYFYYLEPDMGREASRMVNDDIAELCARHPDRLVAMGTVPLQEPRLAVEELERCVKSLGLKAVEISTNVNGEELSEKKFAPFWARAEELGVLVFIHPLGFTDGKRLSRYQFNNVIGNPLESTIAVGHLIFDGVLDRHPGLKICIAHGGGYIAHYIGRMDHVYSVRPEVRGNIKKKPSEYMKRLYFDTVQYDPVEVENLVRRWGADHVLLGTDWPYNMGETDPVGLLKRCGGLTAAERNKIGGLNAAKLLGIKVPK
jgi:aminocarboxymuconate-semialdehyde decarboxylase